jgi:hypothetical protein
VFFIIKIKKEKKEKKRKDTNGLVLLQRNGSLRVYVQKECQFEGG